MVKIEFIGTAAEVLADMRALAFVEPLLPIVPEAALRAEPKAEAPDIDTLAARAMTPTVAEIAKVAQGEPLDNGPAQHTAEAFAAVDALKLYPAVDPAPARKRRTKAEMEAARTAEAAPSVHSEGLPKAEAEALDADATKLEAMGQDAGVKAADLAPNTPLTFEDVKGALKDLCEADGLGVEAGQNLLAAFGVARLSLLDAAKWDDFYGRAKSLVEVGI